MQTSRIRHALSSVQLFVERCLMNLEPHVSPSSVDAKSWEWMKRYRVWEANRKVFLYPENWLEPELRDDKSPFFKELESGLLQSDITEDSAATALLDYLSKLEDVAKLEPCSIFRAEPEPGVRGGIVDHVVARTAGARRKYFYRRRENGPWTPWEQVKLDIEDDPVTIVVWKGRLLLFWLRILRQTPVEPGQLTALPATRPDGSSLPNLNTISIPDLNQAVGRGALAGVKLTVQAVLCWSEYYDGRWQAAKTSDVDRPLRLGRFDVSGDGEFRRADLRLSPAEDGDALNVVIGGAGVHAGFVLYNTHSLPVPISSWPLFLILGAGRGLGRSGDPFTINYSSTLPGLTPLSLTREVLTDPLEPRTVEPQQRLDDPWTAPFFFEDSRHVFFVETTREQVRIDEHLPYGVQVVPGVGERVTSLPPLVRRQERSPRFGPPHPDEGDPDPTVFDPAAARRLVAEDANIFNAIDTNGSVNYDGRAIGPKGTIKDFGGKA
jgi:hypothetical protein